MPAAAEPGLRTGRLVRMLGSDPAAQFLAHADRVDVGQYVIVRIRLMRIRLEWIRTDRPARAGVHGDLMWGLIVTSDARS
jgi:hypothetical protein